MCETMGLGSGGNSLWRAAAHIVASTTAESTRRDRQDSRSGRSLPHGWLSQAIEASSAVRPRALVTRPFGWRNIACRLLGRARRLKFLRVALGEQLGGEALGFGDALDFERNRVHGLLEAFEPVIFERHGLRRLALEEPVAAETRGDDDDGNDGEQCDHVRTRRRQGSGRGTDARAERGGLMILYDWATAGVSPGAAHFARRSLVRSQRLHGIGARGA